jgi:hypothetical protein
LKIQRLNEVEDTNEAKEKLDQGEERRSNEERAKQTSAELAELLNPKWTRDGFFDTHLGTLYLVHEDDTSNSRIVDSWTKQRAVVVAY